MSPNPQQPLTWLAATCVPVLHQMQELRLEREESAQAAEELRIREERRSEDGRSHCRLLSNFPSQTLFSHHMSVGMATHCLSRAAVASMRLAQHQQLQQRQHQQ